MINSIQKKEQNKTTTTKQGPSALGLPCPLRKNTPHSTRKPFEVFCHQTLPGSRRNMAAVSPVPREIWVINRRLTAGTSHQPWFLFPLLMLASGTRLSKHAPSQHRHSQSITFCPWERRRNDLRLNVTSGKLGTLKLKTKKIRESLPACSFPVTNSITTTQTGVFSSGYITIQRLHNNPGFSCLVTQHID